jgi:hypothetical protein
VDAEIRVREAIERENKARLEELRTIQREFFNRRAA